MFTRMRIAWAMITVSLVCTLCTATSNKGTGISFTRVQEPKENAFSMLVPVGWQSQGGIYRINAMQAGGPLNAMEAKCDLTVQSDAQGTVAFHILPDTVYAHTGIGGGFFGPGVNYQGAAVRPLEDATTHVRALFTALHPQAQEIQVVKITRLHGEIQAMNQGTQYLNTLLTRIGLGHQTIQNDAAGGLFEYTENGTRFREILLAGVVDMRAAMTWKNTRSLAFRAPVKAFDQWRPVFDVIRFSVQFNSTWILKEAQGQQERAKIVQKVFDEIRRIDREIVQKTTINREEIMNDNFLVLTEQEEYVNPHNGQVEIDTSAYTHRWVTPGGDVYYTNKEDENPNLFLQRTDYKRTPIRKRRNEP